MSFGLSPCETCVLSASRKIAWPPSCVIPVSKAFRVRVDLSRKSMYSVLSGSSRCGSPRAARVLQLAGDGERLLDLVDRPVDRLDVVAAGERRPVDCGHGAHHSLLFISSCCPRPRPRYSGIACWPGTSGTGGRPVGRRGRPDADEVVGRHGDAVQRLRPIASRSAATTAGVATTVAELADPLDAVRRAGLRLLDELRHDRRHVEDRRDQVVGERGVADDPVLEPAAPPSARGRGPSRCRPRPGPRPPAG